MISIVPGDLFTRMTSLLQTFKTFPGRRIACYPTDQAWPYTSETLILYHFCRNESLRSTPLGFKQPPTTNPKPPTKFQAVRSSPHQDSRITTGLVSHLTPGEIDDEIWPARLNIWLLFMQTTSSWKCQVCVGSHLTSRSFLSLSSAEPKVLSPASSFRSYRNANVFPHELLGLSNVPSMLEQ